MMPNNLSEKIRDGIIQLDKVDLATLLQWSQEATRDEDKGVLGCEIMYRK